MAGGTSPNVSDRAFIVSQIDEMGNAALAEVKNRSRAKCDHPSTIVNAVTTILAMEEVR